ARLPATGAERRRGGRAATAMSGRGAWAGRAAYGEEGACRGVSARSGWRVRAGEFCGR
ncbi:partial CDS, hypothetical, partial [Streptomyces coelicolor A3(2)]